MNFPIFLTSARIVLIPIIVLFFYLPGTMGHLAAALIFAVISITDWFDGYLARNLNQTTSFGAFLDPVADKLAVSVTLILIVGAMPNFYIVMPVAIIIARELIISSLREWMAAIGKKELVVVSKVAKLKTTLQMLAVGSLLLHHPSYGNIFLILGIILLYLATGMTIWSMYVYLKLAWPDLCKDI